MTQFARFGTFNAVLPKEGPLCYPQSLDFRTVGEATVDLQSEIIAGHISYVSGFYADNSANANPLTIVVSTTGQRIIIPAGKQAYMPTLSTTSAVYTLTTNAAANLVIPFFALNFPVWPIIF